MSGYEEWISIIPLINFDSFVQSIKLDDGVCLRRISNDELKKLKDAFPGSRKMLMLALTDVNHVLEINTLTLDGEFVIFDHKQPRVQNVIRALRLLKSGDVTVSCSFLLDENKEASALAWPSSSIVSENRYLLKQEEINRLLELLKKLQNIENNKPRLQFPLHQFMKSYDERSYEDQIVNYSTILDSIVFHKEGRTIPPAGNVIGIAIGMLLGNNHKERMEIKSDIIVAYKIRNYAIHGNIDKLKEEEKNHNMGELTRKIEDYVRSVLRKFVEE